VKAGRALIATYDVPHPDRDSGSRRIFDHLQYLLDAGWAVDFYAVHGVRQGERYGRTLRQLGIGVYEPETAPLDDLLTDRDYTLAHFGFWQIAEQHLPLVRRLRPDIRVVVDSVDLQFLRDARKSFGDPGGLLPQAYGDEFVGELNVYRAADLVLTVSQKEADLIGDLLADPKLAFAVPDSEDLPVSAVPFADRRGIVFVGSFRHAPNLDGVQYLCREVLPLIDQELLAQHPISIVGAGATEALPTGSVPANVRVVGWVPSVIPYIANARVSAVPLRFGAGTKRKLLQSLMLGTPAVSTSIGTEGMALRHGKHALVADDPASFAAAMSDLLQNETLWELLSTEGRKLIERSHEREVVRDRFLRSLAAAFARPAKPSILDDPHPSTYGRRLRYLENQRIAPRIRELVPVTLPKSATIAVVSDGQAELLDLGDRKGWHFPRWENGEFAGLPSSDGDAIAALEEVRRQGAQYLFVPSTDYWWFDHYPGFGEHLRSHYRLVFDQPDVCLVYRLSDAPEFDMPIPQAPVVDPAESVAVREPELAALPADRDAPRLIAFYLPQFHPIPENDEWWGEGFTEWASVAAARPLFDGHYQPHVPADLGFYDLRLPETRLAQAELAREYGISAFCYYHYWFAGKRLLGRPFDEVLASGEPDFPFCLCWANEPWSRRWHGREEDVLQPQKYGRKDDLEHIRWLLPALADPRAITIEDRPLFIVYQGRDLPEPDRTVETWRKEAAKAGLPDLYLMTVETGWDEGWDATKVGFDAKVMFRPQFTTLREAPRIRVDGQGDLEVRDYQAAWPLFARPEEVGYPHFETVFPQWDNSPRTGSRAIVLHNSTPEAYEQWLVQVLGRTRDRPQEEQLVFLNAWNEWAEGCHLEPDLRWGHQYLEATRRALAAAPAPFSKGQPGRLRKKVLSTLAARERR
jgi:glycosyltransferase involved in cell wall biosynthesis